VGRLFFQVLLSSFQVAFSFLTPSLLHVREYPRPVPYSCHVRFSPAFLLPWKFSFCPLSGSQARPFRRVSSLDLNCPPLSKAFSYPPLFLSICRQSSLSPLSNELSSLERGCFASCFERLDLQILRFRFSPSFCAESLRPSLSASPAPPSGKNWFFVFP